MTVDLSAGIRADVGSSNRHQIADITGGASYATGGEALTPNDVRMGKVFMVLGGITNGTVFLLPAYVPSTGKILWQSNQSGAEVANGTNLSGYTGRILVIGL